MNDIIQDKQYIRFALNKIVRDLTYDQLKSNNIFYSKKKKLDGWKWSYNLKRKLIEESYEVLKAKSKKKIFEELSDVFDVFVEILKEYNISISYIIKIGMDKKQSRGGFENKYFIDYIDIPKDHDLIEAYKKSGYKMTEISNDPYQSI